MRKPRRGHAAAAPDVSGGGPSRDVRERTRHATGGLVEHIVVQRSRLADRDLAAQYLNCSPDTVDRLVQTGALPVVKLPVERSANGRGKVGTSRRVLIDVRDLDALIERSKETSG